MFRKRIATLTVLAVAAAQCIDVPAWAGPDDGKSVQTQIHVDSPKAMYADGKFFLNSTSRIHDTRLDDSVIWVGKGYRRDGQPAYQLTLGEKGFDFLGNKGENFYLAPGIAGLNLEPVWWGYGADGTLPLDDFQDQMMFLDLVSVDGPGDLELMHYKREDLGPHRFMGSFPDSGRSVKLIAGSHVHVSTVFSKPGRYELTYRLSGLKNSGELVTSEEQKLAVQVGGMRPLDTPTPSLVDRYNSAPVSAAAGFELSLNPAGREELTDITVKAPHANGTATLLIDGFHLTDLPLENGVATWPEFLGPRESTIQAVVTTDEGKWISNPIQYQPGQSASTTESASSLVEPKREKRNFFSQEVPSLTSTGATFDISQRNDGFFDINIATEDPNFRGIIRLEFYESENAKLPISETEIPIENGKGARPYGRVVSGSMIKARVIPHPSFGEKNVTSVLTTKHEGSKTYTTSGNDATGATFVPAQPASAQPVPSKSPVPEPSISDTPSAEDPVSSPLVLDKGHVDIAAVLEDGKLDVRIKDETNLHGKGTIMRNPEDVVFVLKENAFNKKRPSKDDFAFLGDEGFYLAPETQNHHIVWPGFNTETLKYSELGGSVHLRMEPLEVPEGSRWGAFYNAQFNAPPTILLNSDAEDHVIDTEFARHAHLNWFFTKPGTYTFEVSYEAGNTPTTKRKVTFEVDKENYVPQPVESNPADNQKGDSQEGNQPEGEKPGDDMPDGNMPDGNRPDAGNGSADPGENKPAPSKPGGAKAIAAVPQALPVVSFNLWAIVVPMFTVFAIIARVMSFARS